MTHLEQINRSGLQEMTREDRRSSESSNDCPGLNRNYVAVFGQELDKLRGDRQASRLLLRDY